MFHFDHQVNSFDEFVLYRYRFSYKDKVKKQEIKINSEQIKINTKSFRCFAVPLLHQLMFLCYFCIRK
jgi:hypothetical protein